MTSLVRLVKLCKLLLTGYLTRRIFASLKSDRGLTDPLSREVAMSQGI